MTPAGDHQGSPGFFSQSAEQGFQHMPLQDSASDTPVSSVTIVSSSEMGGEKDSVSSGDAMATLIEENLELKAQVSAAAPLVGTFRDARLSDGACVGIGNLHDLLPGAMARRELSRTLLLIRCSPPCSAPPAVVWRGRAVDVACLLLPLIQVFSLMW